jgi:hypothetical protein
MLQIDNLIRTPTGASTVAAYDAFLDKLGDRDRLNVQRHVAFCETEPTDVHERSWKGVASFLSQLAPLTPSTTGQRAVRFFIADGKYRLQIFALEDLRDGNLVVYANDKLSAALESGVVHQDPIATGDAAMLYEIGAAPGDTLRIERLTAGGTTSAPDYYKHMLGWNRRAMKITLPLVARPATMPALLALCVLSVQTSDVRDAAANSH